MWFLTWVLEYRPVLPPIYSCPMHTWEKKKRLVLFCVCSSLVCVHMCRMHMILCAEVQRSKENIGCPALFSLETRYLTKLKLGYSQQTPEILWPELPTALDSDICTAIADFWRGVLEIQTQVQMFAKVCVQYVPWEEVRGWPQDVSSSQMGDISSDTVSSLGRRWGMEWFKVTPWGLPGRRDAEWGV